MKKLSNLLHSAPKTAPGWYNEIEKSLIGDSVIFKGVPEFYYPMFIDMRERANSNLVVGQSYKISKLSINSSWSSVELEGIDGKFNSTFFE